jgi:dipeptidyl aminopeptidase/acylaminoacyl peptidase
VEAFGRLPSFAEAAISPDGTKILFKINNGESSFFAFNDVAESRWVRTFDVPEDHIGSIGGWATETAPWIYLRLTLRESQLGNVYLRGNTNRIDYVRPVVIDLETRRANSLTTSRAGDLEATLPRVEMVSPIEGDEGFTRLISMTGRGLRVFRAPLGRGEARRRDYPGINDDTYDILLDRRGDVAVRTDINDRTNTWQVYIYDGRTPRLLLEGVSETGAPINIAGLLPDGRLASFEDDADGFGRLMALDRQTGEPTEVFAQPGKEVLGAVYDPWTREIVGVRWFDGVDRVTYLDPVLERLSTELQQAFGGARMSFTDWSRDRTKLLLFAEYATPGGAFFLFDTATRQAKMIGEHYPELAGTTPATRRRVTYPARDGTQIPAYITEMPGVSGPRPVVALVHGGPHARDDGGFDWWASFLASRGYTVIQPQFRGSTGLGTPWIRAGYGQWGGLMQTDVEDGVRHLISTGAADPERVCIIGASYGGYAALTGAFQTPDLYKCAVGVAGVYDLAEMLAEEARQLGRDSVGSDFWRRSIGDPRTDAARIRDVSPLQQAERIGVPVLLMHGENDTVVPISQSTRLRDRLRQLNKPVTWVQLREDDHYLSREATRVQMLAEIETFLATHIGQ